ncbi:lytic transglycosylase domain-containing protein [Parapedobacter koreensis]|uniref:Transglycosylase SLT domain-containing protein n=1 Tax=Parapedobacter koreensis TaxID=332977 RepID=A0A1H7G4A5_9SPHI|nr:lytic transglycosylase domain-containing protein [Parapedobacter koreensis]SEK33186.1 Transglycosylase SLT domain-containing protein [Parapedobacter koreensis]
MIKKQLLCFSAVLLLVLISKLYAYRIATNIETSALSQDPLSQGVMLQEDIANIRNTPYFASLNFADENLPLGDQQIERKMMRYLKEYSYTKRRSHLLHNRALSALPKVAAILREYGIPEDFKYIPLVESGLVDGTTSHRGASGYWQFMPSTARAFGLRVDANVDDRHHIEKSTIAAAKYIKALYHEFNSWTLVAAAFNIGEGNLRRAIDKQHEDNYFRLKLNRETGSYVYKLISVKEIIENPVAFGYRKQNHLLADAMTGTWEPNAL